MFYNNTVGSSLSNYYLYKYPVDKPQVCPLYILRSMGNKTFNILSLQTWPKQEQVHPILDIVPEQQRAAAEIKMINFNNLNSRVDIIIVFDPFYRRRLHNIYFIYTRI